MDVERCFSLTFSFAIAFRWMTCQCLLDFNTMAGADKFGNVFVVSMRSLVAGQLSSTTLSEAVNKPLTTCQQNGANTFLGVVDKSLEQHCYITGVRCSKVD